MYVSAVQQAKLKYYCSLRQVSKFKPLLTCIYKREREEEGENTCTTKTMHTHITHYTSVANLANVRWFTGGMRTYHTHF